MKKYLILLFIFLLVSCNTREIFKDTITVALSQEMPTLDPHKNTSQVIRYILCGNTFERLLELDKDGNITKVLVSDYKSEAGGRVWHFDIKEDVYFHDGSPLDGEVVAASLNRWIASYSAIKKMVGDTLFTYSGNRVTISLDEPIIFLDTIIATSPIAAVIIAKSSLESLDESGFLTSYIGTGPYRFVSYTVGDNVYLTRSDNYNGDKKAYIKNLKYCFVPDSLVRTLGCEKGEYDFINDVMSQDFERLRENDELVLSLGEEAGSYVLLFNKRGHLAKHKYIREAVNRCLDLDAVMKACYGQEGYNIHPNYMEAHQREYIVPGLDKYFNYNEKERAREILINNGYKGETFTILSSNLSNMDKSALVIKSELEKIGMRVNLIVVDWATMMDYRNDEDMYDLCITAMTTVPLPSLKLYFDPNYPGWSDDIKLQELLDRFNSSESEDEALEVWEEIQVYSYQYLPCIIAGHYKSGYLYNKYLKGIIESNGFYFYNALFSN